MSDVKYEVKTVKFSKDKFLVKIYDTVKRKGQTIDIQIPEEVNKIANKFFSYVSIEHEVIMTGG